MLKLRQKKALRRKCWEYPLSTIHVKHQSAFSLLRITVPLEKPYPESDMLIHTDSTQESEGSLNYTQYKQSKPKPNKQKWCCETVVNSDWRIWAHGHQLHYNEMHRSVYLSLMPQYLSANPPFCSLKNLLTSICLNSFVYGKKTKCKWPKKYNSPWLLIIAN